MPRLSVTVDVPAPPQQVWDAITDWPRQGEWMLGTRVRRVGEQRGAGERLEAFTGVGRLGFLDTMTVTEWQPPHRCVVDHTGRVVRGLGVFEVRPAAGGSQLTWVEDLDVPGGVVGRVAFALVRPLAVAGVRWSLARFARSVTLAS